MIRKDAYLEGCVATESCGNKDDSGLIKAITIMKQWKPVKEAAALRL